MKDADRRIHKRFSVQPLLCRTDPRLPGVCVLRNVSMGGAFFLHSSPPPVGASLRIGFNEPPLEDYDLSGRVVRHTVGDTKGFAVGFANPHPRLLRAVYCNEYPD